MMLWLWQQTVLCRCRNDTQAEVRMFIAPSDGLSVTHHLHWLASAVGGLLRSCYHGDASSPRSVFPPHRGSWCEAPFEDAWPNERIQVQQVVAGGVVDRKWGRMDGWMGGQTDKWHRGRSRKYSERWKTNESRKRRAVWERGGRVKWLCSSALFTTAVLLRL